MRRSRSSPRARSRASCRSARGSRSLYPGRCSTCRIPRSPPGTPRSLSAESLAWNPLSGSFTSLRLSVFPSLRPCVKHPSRPPRRHSSRRPRRPRRLGVGLELPEVVHRRLKPGEKRRQLLRGDVVVAPVCGGRRLGRGPGVAHHALDPVEQRGRGGLLRRLDGGIAPELHPEIPEPPREGAPPLGERKSTR